MRQFARPQEYALDVLAAQLAETVAHAMDHAGMALNGTNRVALISALGKALACLEGERECAVRQSRIERRTSWVEEESLLSAAETSARLGLTLREVETARALGIIAPVEVPVGLCATSAHFTPESWHYYRPDVTLTAADRARIAHETLLTRAQAADRLGLPLVAFDRLRMAYGLARVEPGLEQGATQLHLYRTDAVDQLAAVEPA